MRFRPLILALVVASILGALYFVFEALETEADARRDETELAQRGPSAVSDAITRVPAEARAREVIAPAPTQLTSTIRVEGRVLDHAGAPAAGAAIWIQWLDAPSTETAAWNLARGDGTFTFDVERNAFRIQAAGRDSGEAARVVELDPSARTARLDDLHLPPGGVIRGRVLDVRGRGVEHVAVECSARQGAVWMTTFLGHEITAGHRRVVTDEQGRFAARGLRACAHRVSIEADFRLGRWNFVEVEFAHPDGEELLFQELADGTLAGRVVDEDTGRPIPSFTVEDEEHTDADGRFEIQIVAREPIFVSAEGYSGNLWWPKDGIEPGSRHEVTIALQRHRNQDQPRLGKLTLRAKDELGSPVSGLRLRRLYGSRPELWLDDELIGAVTADPLGGDLLVVSRAETGRELCIDAPGHALVRATLDRTPAEDQELLVVLERGAAVEIVVRDDLGLPARNWRFELDSARRKEREFVWRAPNVGIVLARTDSAELFATHVANGRIEGLPAGKYTLIVHASEERSASFELEVRAEEPVSYDFQFPPP